MSDDLGDTDYADELARLDRQMRAAETAIAALPQPHERDRGMRHRFAGLMGSRASAANLKARILDYLAAKGQDHMPGPSMAPGGDGFALTVAVSFNSPDVAAALNLPGSLVPRGAALPPSVWPLMANLERMVAAGVLAWRPQAPARLSRAAPPAAALSPIAPRNFVEELRVALKPHLDAKRPLDEAFDLIDQGLLIRAVAQFAHRSGQAAGQRSPQGFRTYLMEAVP